ncbi:CHAT domain-containing protein [Pseudomonas sp. MAG002Y]|uniref:CHAT domain-containing protein n=1 Tax=Pseudomonas sp. MAG002Y TaxID=2678690 RepID=UPI001C60A39F|nr:CHAT domain-containing protein [Pseudomonas sp. MAG002Y]MBW5416332.1 CHAT domain-containing protein [Pseudomonas sp. MAG002Y]
MSQIDNYRRAINHLQVKEAALYKDLNHHKVIETRALECLNKQLAAANRASSASMHKSYTNAAIRAKKKEEEASHKIANLLQKIAANRKEQTQKTSQLIAAERAEQATRVRQDEQRRRQELEHQRKVNQLTKPKEIRYIYTRPPELEKLRVLYLAANPLLDLRTEFEFREVQQALRSAKYRDLVEIYYRPAASFQDLLDGINDVKPHIIHFSGHSARETLAFDLGVNNFEGDLQAVAFSLLEQALGATDYPPVLVVLNSCQSLDGAECLLSAVPFVIGMPDEIQDSTAIVFSKQFYAAIASSQSISSSLDQAKVKIIAASLDGMAVIPQIVHRAEFDPQTMRLVKPNA